MGDASYGLRARRLAAPAPVRRSPRTLALLRSGGAGRPPLQSVRAAVNGRTGLLGKTGRRAAATAGR